MPIIGIEHSDEGLLKVGNTSVGDQQL